MSAKVAVSDLHSRLDYLVGFTSHLVFVANDDLHFQQNTLQSFIAQQHENVEVAFLKGELDRSAEDYRKEISRQILRKVTGQFELSLRKVLNDFDGVENPILICLCAAQHLPQNVLEELWELVLLARTLDNKLHVSVLLFGDSKWVVDAKKKLPTNKGSKPVLLSTEMDSTAMKVDETQPLSELDTLIANKRAAFAERVHARTADHSPNENNPSLIQTTKFKLGIGLVFIATFAALILWFYPQHTDPKTPVSTESNLPIKSENEIEIDLPVEIPEFILNELDTIGTVETIVAPGDDEIESKEEQQFVTQWNSSESVEPKEAAEPITEELTISTVSPSVETSSTPLNSLETVQSGKFLVQIASAANLQRAEQFISNNSLQQSTWIYTTNRYGGSWHVVLINKSFQSNSEARNYITTLSEQIKKSSPFVKSIELIREEIAIAN